VVAGVRNVATQAAALDELPKADGSQLITVQLDSSSETDAEEAVRELRNDYGLSYLDVVIANAAIAANYGPASTMAVEHLDMHIKVNTYAVLRLFQCVLRMLQEAASHAAPPQFVLVGAPLSTITQIEDCARAPLINYGLSKLAANYLVRKFHFENKWLVAYIVDPG
jgi:norsolorinic acid ketoreductase